MIHQRNVTFSAQTAQNVDRKQATLATARCFVPDLVWTALRGKEKRSCITARNKKTIWARFPICDWHSFAIGGWGCCSQISVQDTTWWFASCVPVVRTNRLWSTFALAFFRCGEETHFFFSPRCRSFLFTIRLLSVATRGWGVGLVWVSAWSVALCLHTAYMGWPYYRVHAAFVRVVRASMPISSVNTGPYLAQSSDTSGS